jgi:hypothetical protein
MRLGRNNAKKAAPKYRTNILAFWIDVVKRRVRLLSWPAKIANEATTCRTVT